MRKHFEPIFTKATYLLIGLYVFSLVFWLYFTSVNTDFAPIGGEYFQILLILIPLTGVFIGLRNSKLWGGSKSILGKSLLFLSLGQLFWLGGITVWNMYLFFLHVDVPYPSVADALFIWSWPLWTAGVLYLGKAIGARAGIKKMSGKVLLILAPLILIVLSYLLLVQVARAGTVTDGGGSMKLFFDLFYPIGSTVIATVVLTIYLLSVKYMGGRYRVPTLILFVGFMVNYFADFMFSYTTTQGTYFNGNIADLLFATSMFIISFALSQLVPDIS